MDLEVLTHIALFIVAGAATVFFIYVLTEALNTPDEPRGRMIRIRAYATVCGLIALFLWLFILYRFLTAPD